jgi:hypothetical protein
MGRAGIIRPVQNTQNTSYYSTDSGAALGWAENAFFDVTRGQSVDMIQFLKLL